MSTAMLCKICLNENFYAFKDLFNIIKAEFDVAMVPTQFLNGLVANFMLVVTLG